MKSVYSFKRIIKAFCLRASTHLPVNNRVRVYLASWGVKIMDKKRCFIGDGVIFDSLYPENIIMEKGSYLTMRCIILAHFMDTKTEKGTKWSTGKVILREGCFVGCGTIITNPVEIGEHSIVGAGSLVTKNIPPYEIWGGNPARFIKRRGMGNSEAKEEVSNVTDKKD